MKITFENLGPIEFGELELADLTIVCGKNNTGKTYVTYLVYCLLNTWKQLTDVSLRSAFLELRRNGIATLDLQKEVADRWPTIKEETLGKFIQAFPEMLASKEERFSNLTLALDISLGSEWMTKAYVSELRSAKGSLLITINKAANATTLQLTAPKTEDLTSQSMAGLHGFIEEHILGLMLGGVIPEVFLASTERTGATTFKKQLNLATSNLIDLLSQTHKDGAETLTPNKVFQTIYGKPEYALPVRHNVSFINQLPNSGSQDGPLCKVAPNLLKKFESIVGGTYVTNKEGVTEFRPQGTNIKLNLGEVSSSVRSLLIVWYWLKHFAKQGDLLMLDEPELNLHPANQRRLARFLAALVNHGLKIFITTHSDYIVKEFNTLIMLNQKSSKMEEVLSKLKEYSPEDRLDPARIALYMAKEEKILKTGAKRKTSAKTLVKADISPSLGIEASSFDDTIDDMNSVQEAIYYGLN